MIFLGIDPAGCAEQKEQKKERREDLVTPSCSLSFSISATRSHVVFSSKDPRGLDLPQPLWSKSTIW
jgi:hypothetical protein